MIEKNLNLKRKKISLKTYQCNQTNHWNTQLKIKRSNLYFFYNSIFNTNYLLLQRLAVAFHENPELHMQKLNKHKPVMHVVEFVQLDPKIVLATKNKLFYIKTIQESVPRSSLSFEDAHGRNGHGHVSKS
jgi:hypothetical protein